MLRVAMGHVPTRHVVDRTPKRAPGETAEIVLALAKQGKGVREIARLCDISTQAASGHLKRLRTAGRLDGDAA